MELTKWFKKYKLISSLKSLNQTGKEGSVMIVYLMTEAEMQLAEIIWRQEPLTSGELVKLAGQELNWKKSTTYTVLRKICTNDIFQNVDSVVSSRMSREEYIRRKGERYLDENYNGSLPGFVAAFLKKKKISRKELEELEQMIEEYKEE